MSSNKRECDQKSTQTAMPVSIDNISPLIAETGKLRTNNEELIFPAVSHILRTVLPCQKPNIGGNWKHSNLSYLGTAGSCCASD
ncbi:hypothetical protein T09_12979 [Trichinella sp. T9]|nr:hypothetical protein T09_12979 [Trichinella sp. T9]